MQTHPAETELRVAVIGTGFGARVHVPAFQTQPGVDVVAICSARLERARNAAQRHGVAYYFDDYQQMLDEVRPDIVSIATPPRLHSAMTIDALAHGSHVLCEKPLALDLSEADLMLRTARAARQVHAVGHELRFLPQYQEITRLVASNILGTIISGAVHVVQWPRAAAPDPAHTWLTRREEGGGVLNLWGTHYADLLRLWLGPIVEVVSTVRTVLRRRCLPWVGRRLSANSEDTAAVLIRFESGATVSMFLSNAAAQGRGPRVELQGTRGSIVCDAGRVYLAVGRSLMRSPELRIAGPEPMVGIERARRNTQDAAPVLPYGDDSLAAYCSLVHELTAAIDGCQHQCPTFEDGYLSLAFADACRESASTGRWVRPAPPPDEPGLM